MSPRSSIRRDLGTRRLRWPRCCGWPWGGGTVGRSRNRTLKPGWEAVQDPNRISVSFILDKELDELCSTSPSTMTWYLGRRAQRNALLGLWRLTSSVISLDGPRHFDRSASSPHRLVCQLALRELAAQVSLLRKRSVRVHGLAITGPCTREIKSSATGRGKVRGGW